MNQSQGDPHPGHSVPKSAARICPRQTEGCPTPPDPQALPPCWPGLMFRGWGQGKSSPGQREGSTPPNPKLSWLATLGRHPVQWPPPGGAGVRF